MRLKRILIIGTIFPVLFSIVLFFGILISGEDDDSSNSYSPVYSGMNLSADVLKHQPMVERYARENGISEYVNVLLSIIQVESGGTATDVMQSSESLGLPPNSLSTEESIKQGCKYFASLLSSCCSKQTIPVWRSLVSSLYSNPNILIYDTEEKIQKYDKF